MEKINLEDHVYFTNSILKALAQNRITTLIQFIQEDPEKLSVLTKLNLPQILEIRNDVFDKYSAPVISGAALKHLANKKKGIPTGIESLDAIMDEGIPIGCITEICGLAGCGKSQLCMQLSINCVKDCNNTILYIDTKGDFSAVRIQKLLEMHGLSHEEMAVIMIKIRVVHVWCMEELMKLLEQLKRSIIKIDKLSLVIVDSLPCLQFQHFGDDNKLGLTYLNKVVNLSRCLSKELEIGFIYVNIQTRWIDQDIPDVEDEEQSTSANDPLYIERRNRCLGKYWQTIPAVLLLVEKDEHTVENINDILIKVTVTKHINPYISKSCILKINKLGIS